MAPVFLSLQLAFLTTLILLILGTPIAWWLSKTTSPLKPFISAFVALPFVLPPTVLGFYLLLFMGQDGPLGKITAFLGMAPLPFSFTGLVVASVFYSLPFAVQPLQNAFETIGKTPLDAAATLRASSFDTFWHVVIPLAKPGYITALVMTFAHTMGEFGVVLMMGGNIPNKTRVLSVQIFDHVEALEYTQAHWLSAGMLFFCFAVLFIVYRFNPTLKRL